ncbi:hypothetical protein LSAT2_009261 [Lamellibrachia satsuma]|nr:hypothetical protein LSAT2_009261 [Lamellibrachia satsuma]
MLQFCHYVGALIEQTHAYHVCISEHSYCLCNQVDDVTAVTEHNSSHRVALVNTSTASVIRLMMSQQ